MVGLGALLLGLDVPDGGAVTPEDVEGVLDDLHLACHLFHHRIPAHVHVEGGLQGLAHRLHPILDAQYPLPLALVLFHGTTQLRGEGGEHHDV